jgi:hypothetical protein
MSSKEDKIKVKCLYAYCLLAMYLIFPIIQILFAVFLKDVPVIARAAFGVTAGFIFLIALLHLWVTVQQSSCECL